MTEEPRDPIMRRLTQGERKAPAIGEVTPAKALRLALSKAGQDVLAQPVSGSGVEDMRVSVSQISEQLPEHAMTVLLTGQGESHGLLALDLNLVAAITGALTTGRIVAGPTPTRRATRIDAQLCTRFLTAVLAMFAVRLLGHPDSDWAKGWVPEEQIDDLRKLPILLEDVQYRLIRMESDFGGGARIGPITIILPIEQAAMPAISDPNAEQEKRDAWKEKMRRVTMSSKIPLNVLLLRKKVPADLLRSLQPGDLLPVKLPAHLLKEVILETKDRAPLVKVQLGEQYGMRSLKVIDPQLFNRQASVSQVQQEVEEDEGPDKAELLSGLADAMTRTQSPFEQEAEEEPLADFPAMDLSFDEEAESDEGEESGFPAMDLGDLDFGDLDDLPETIE